MDVTKLRAAMAQPEAALKIEGKVVWRASESPNHAADYTETERLRGQIIRRVSVVRGSCSPKVPVAFYREWLELYQPKEGEVSNECLFEVLSDWVKEIRGEL